MQDDEFRTFYLAHVHRLHSYITKTFGDPSAADDVVQEAFLRVFSADLSNTMSSGHLKNYLYKVATNLARRRVRFSGREQIGDLPDPASTADFDDVVAVRSALASMKPRDRGLLWLAYVENLSHRDISAISGYRENSVRTLVHRAKEKLIRLLQGSERK